MLTFIQLGSCLCAMAVCAQHDAGMAVLSRDGVSVPIITIHRYSNTLVLRYHVVPLGALPRKPQGQNQRPPTRAGNHTKRRKKNERTNERTNEEEEEDLNPPSRQAGRHCASHIVLRLMAGFAVCVLAGALLLCRNG